MIEKQFGLAIHPIWHEDVQGNPDKYISDVRRELGAILTSRSGKALARSLKYWSISGHKVTIMPYEFGDDNAQEDGITPGSRESAVLITPSKRKCPCSTVLPRALSREMLYHELVHALRRVSGNMHSYQAREQLSSYNNSEEFIAIMATNIFISDTTNIQKSGLRFDHHGHSALPEELAGSYKYFTQGLIAFHWIERFCFQNPTFTRALAAVPARFNPIAAYYHNRNKAFDAAANGDADYFLEHHMPLDFARDGNSWNRILRFDPLKN